MTGQRFLWHRTLKTTRWRKRSNEVKSSLAQGIGRIGALAILVPDNKSANSNNAPTSVSTLAFTSRNSKYINY